MNTEALRSQIRALVQSRHLQSNTANATAVVIPLRLNGTEDMSLLAQLLQRLAASPTLSQAAAAGLVRLDITVGTGALTASCEPCQASPQASCACSTAATSNSVAVSPSISVETMELSGLISEKKVRQLAASIRQVTIAADAVLTPMGRDALKRQGITLLPKKKG